MRSMFVLSGQPPCITAKSSATGPLIGHRSVQCKHGFEAVTLRGRAC